MEIASTSKKKMRTLKLLMEPKKEIAILIYFEEVEIVIRLQEKHSPVNNAKCQEIPMIYDQLTDQPNFVYQSLTLDQKKKKRRKREVIYDLRDDEIGIV